MNINMLKIILMALMLLCLFTCSEPTESVEELPNSTIIKVGALLDLSGSDRHAGIAIETALKIRMEMINNMLEELFSDAELQLVVMDTETDPDIALEKLQELHNDTITMVIGPMTSAELEAVADYANEHQIVLISPSSTAPSLAIPDDFILRFCPNDILQSKAIAALMNDDGIKCIIPIHSNDNYGSELAYLVATEFVKLGGESAASLSYATNETDFSSSISDLTELVKQTRSNYSNNEIGVFLIGFDESATLLSEAFSADTVLSALHWYGCDGNSLNETIIENRNALEMAGETHFSAASFGREEDTDVDDIILNEITRRTGYVQVSMAAIYAYDALYTFFLAYTRVHENDGTRILHEFPSITKAFYGASGWVELDRNGDRIYGDYDFWTVDDQTWVKTARYEINRGAETGTLIQIQ